MKSAFLLCCLIALLLCRSMPSTAEPDYEALDALTEGGNKFAVALYQALSRNGGNVVVSPVSLQLVLALAQCGATGPTADEISKVLGLPDSLDLSLNGHKSLIQLLQLPVLTLANRMFVDSKITLKKDFQDLSGKYFFATAETAKFSENPNAACEFINQWVEDNTNKKIKDLLSSDSITTETKLVLINAVHFKANWALKFDVTNTQDEPFYITPSETVQVPMMHINKKFNYSDNKKLNAQLVELPYEGREMRMILIVPKEKDGLAGVESELGKINLAELFLSLSEANVDLKLPRFKIEQTIDLNQILLDMGVQTMFTDNANFSGISETEPLKVSKVVQKAFIDVNEEGTEAAAATAMVMVRCCAVFPTEQVTLVADRPFLFALVRDRRHVVFIGHVSRAA